MMNNFNAYKWLSDACIKFCEEHDNTFNDIVAKVHTDVLDDTFVYCSCEYDHFEFLIDWYEGGNVTILAMGYFDDVAERGLK